jgi:Mce-associated membrane protein
MVTSPTWYDLIGVDPDASSDEVRAAWKAATADLDPGPRLDTLNRAAAVLLDPVKREQYDATLTDERRDGVATDEPPTPASTPAEEGDDEPATERPRRVEAVPSWLLAGLAVLALASAVLLAVVWTRADAGSGEAAREAQQAAERAVVPVLSYDHKALEQSKEAAQAQMTGRYSKEYAKLFALLEENAPRTETTVTAEVVASGVVRSGDDRVQVLVFVDRPTTNKQDTEPVVYRDQVTLSMQRVGDQWLVDDMVTSPVPE